MLKLGVPTYNFLIPYLEIIVKRIYYTLHLILLLDHMKYLKIKNNTMKIQIYV